MIQGLLLTEGLKMLEDTKEKISKVPGPVGKVEQDKLNYVLSNNPGLKVIQQAGDILLGKRESLPEHMMPAEVALLKYWPMAADVEWSFSVYKSILSDRRTNFTCENL